MFRFPGLSFVVDCCTCSSPPAAVFDDGACATGLVSLLTLPLRRRSRGLIAVSVVILVNAIYSSLATEILSRWLDSHLPAPIVRVEGGSPSVAVRVGPGYCVAQATSAKAALQL